jgi:hypothetical protein
MASSALNLLCSYESDEEDFGSDKEELVEKKQNLLPLPNEIKTLFDKQEKELCPGTFKANYFFYIICVILIQCKLRCCTIDNLFYAPLKLSVISILFLNV